MDIAESVFLISADFPKEERFWLQSQIRRCAVSIVSNIAEGAGRFSKNQFKYFLSVSLGSGYELETQLFKFLSSTLYVEWLSTMVSTALLPMQRSQGQSLIIGKYIKYMR